MIALTIFSALVLLAFLLNYLHRMKNARFYQLLEQFPSYPTYPIIGNLHLLCGWADNTLPKTMKLIKPYNRVVFWIGPVPTIVLKKYDDIMTILNQCNDRDTLGFHTHWCDKGVLTGRYEDWKRSKKVILPAFTSGMFPKYVNVFNEKASRFVDMFKSAADSGEIIDVWQNVERTNADIATENIMNVHITSTGKKGVQFVEGNFEFMHDVYKRTVSPWLHPNFVYSIYLKITGKSKFINYFKDLPADELKKKLAYLRRTESGFDEIESSKAVIDLLLKQSLQDDTYSETRIRDELAQISGAGVAVPTLTTSYLLVLFAINQDVQQKAYEEITQLLGENDTLTTDQLTNELKYLEQCIKETIRVYTSATITGRRTHKECALPDNTIIPADTMVVLHLYAVHYDEDLYDNPNTWDPQHFSNEAEAKRPQGSSLLFGYGPRYCPASKYAMMTVKTQVAYILRKYHLSTNIKGFPEDKFRTDLIMRSEIGYPVRFTSRRNADLK
uniref:Cytochrome P450 4461R1 n=1 Tax=Maconellicoccus hirsutus TaxID=177089 RepID=A0AAT9UTP6_MACHI